MSRHPTLRKLLDLQYQVDSAKPEERKELQVKYEKLVQEVLEGTTVSRQSLLAALQKVYGRYRRARLKGDGVDPEFNELD